MRRAARLLALAALLAAVVTAISGPLVTRATLVGGGAAPLGLLAHPSRLAHDALGAATVVATALLASLCFVLGLSGVLEGRPGRRLGSALLLVLAPLLMGAAIASAATGWIGGRTSASAPVEEPPAIVARTMDLHAIRATGALLALLAVTALTCGWAARPSSDADETDET